MKRELCLTLLLASNMASADFTVETKLEDYGARTYDYVKNHFSFAYHGEFYGLRRDVNSESVADQKISDLKIMHNPTITYKMADNWQLSTTAEFKYSDLPDNAADASFPNGFYRGLSTFTRKNVLSEKEHGIELDLGIARRQFNTGSKQASGAYALSSYGNNRAIATLIKNFGKNNANLVAQFLNNDFKTNKKTTWKNSVELVPTLTLQLTDKISYMINDDMVINLAKDKSNVKQAAISHEMNFAYVNVQWTDKLGTYLQEKYVHVEDFTNNFQSQKDSMIQFVGLSFSATPKAIVTFEVSQEVLKSADSRTFSKGLSNPELALYLDYSI
jgi:hypothetical protein